MDQLESGDKGGTSSGPLYGASAQQLVADLRAGPTWRRAEDLAAALRLEVAVAELLLEALSEHEVVQRHPVRPAWGLGPAVEDVDRQGELLSNFSTGSRPLKVYWRDRLLGEVPFTNMAALAGGSPFALLGRVWVTERCFRDQLHVREHNGKPAVEVKYNAPGALLAPATVDRLLRVLAADLPPSVRFERATEEWYQQVSGHLAAPATEWDQILRWWAGGRWHHLTLAGRLLNGAVGRLLGEASAQDDCVLTTESLVDFAELSAAVVDWQAALVDLVAAPTRLSAWQQRLPAELLREELLQDVLTHPQTARTITRLRAACVIDAVDDRLEAFRHPSVALPRPF